MTDHAGARRVRRAALSTAATGVVVLVTAVSGAVSGAASADAVREPHEVVQQVCTACHNPHTLQAGLDLTGFDPRHPQQHPVVAEKMIRKLRAGQMPPREFPRDPAELEALASMLEQRLDRAAREQARVGTRPFQRVNRAEYEQLIHDLLGLRVDAADWLPEDPISDSFDNIADVQALSATLMTAYLTAASDIARMALGWDDAPALETTYSNPANFSQHEWERAEGAPWGTRGGISALHNFPADGEYVFSMRFMSGWGEQFHDIDVSIDGERVALVKYGGDIDYQGLKDFPVQTPPVFIRAGEHRVAAAWIRQMDGPYEDLLRPNERSLTGTETSYGTTSPPNLMHLTIDGPYNAVGVSSTETRKRIFSCRPLAADEERPCAEEIVSRLAADAYGEALTEEQLADLMHFYRLGAGDGGFEMGIRSSLEAILASPYFLFRVEQQPARARPGDRYRLDDVDLARRLSFFLWGTNPDEELLAMANRGKLQRSRTLEAQARRMLADPRSIALAERFASLWLHLQDLDALEPDEYWYPYYTRQLVEAMRKETILFFDHLVRDNRSVLDLYGADYSIINERLAKHYGIPGVHGDEFRKVEYPNEQRRGLLGHGSILALTSLGNRTSPVLRGKWVIEVLVGTPPPPPPPGIPDLEETSGARDGEVLTTRRRMEMHRANAICAACHKVMDPIGLALDNFDVTGRWRIRENGAPLDTRSTFYDGTDISTPADLSRVLLARPVPLVREFTSKLMAYALGRRVEYFDMPAVREIVDNAGEDGYGMSAIILGVILSEQFRMKDVVEPETSEPDITMTTSTR